MPAVAQDRSVVMPLSKDDIAGIEAMAPDDRYIHDEDQAYLMLYGVLPSQLPL